MTSLTEKDLEQGHFESSNVQNTRPESSRLQAITHVSTRSSNRSRTYGGEDGYAVFEDEEVRQDPDQANTPIESERDDYEKEKGQNKSKEDDVIIVNWDDGDNDPLNPRQMSVFRRWIVTLIISCASLCVTCTSSIYTLIYKQTMPEFHTSQIVMTLGLSLFVGGLGLGPMLLAPLSEFYGRKPVYVISFLLFLIWLIPCAVADNITTLLVARFFNGLSGSAFLSVAGGTVGDMFAKKDLSIPMMVYTASPFIGPEFGPLIGGFINQFTNWRWSFWVMMIWTGVMFVLITFLVPETYHPVLLRNKARALRKETGDNRYKAQIEIMDKTILRTVALSCKRPFELLFFEPMCLNLCLLSSLLLGILYLFFGAFPLVFQNNHGFQLYQVGLSFLGLFVGMLAGIISHGVVFTRHYQMLVRKEEEKTGNKGASEPEFRLPSTVLGAWIVPIGLFGFAWTTYSHVHWIAPIVFSGVFGLGNVWCFSGIFTFLVEAYPMYAASALAANSFARSSFAAAFPLFGVQMYNKLGYQWATSLLAFLALAMAPFPYIFYIYGKKIRKSSRFASA